MSTPGKTRIFEDIIKTEGKIKSYPFRCNLKECIEKVEQLTNEKVIGIVYDETFTIELLTIEEPEIKNTKL